MAEKGKTPCIVGLQGKQTKASPSYEVLSYDNLAEREKWRSLCQRFKDIDIFYYPEYAYLFQLKGDGQAKCFVYYESDEDVVIYPFLQRPINELSIFHDLPDYLIDIVTPYGYGGYLQSSSRVDMEKFYAVFKQYCRENNIVSEFIRFHPLLENHAYCPFGVNIQQWNNTVVIDLTANEDILWQAMTPTCRNKIRKARKHGINVALDTNCERLTEFYNLYTTTMDRVKAQSYYYFSKSWYSNIVKLLSGKLALFHAFQQAQILASGLFLFSNNYIHYFLSGSLYEMRYLAANNLLLYNVALWAKAKGLKYFYLGGGYQPNDSLFRFKNSFAPLIKPFYIGTVIHDQEYYDYLAQRAPCLEYAANDIYFFPKYRKTSKTVLS
ncbi:MAG: peptidoglycan bridge formation glycyltransferase FemA/FemB family protein [Desulfobacca sp.]|nr:peptidoglycan bridge formation glycyltransferase FemA/FemB family protein [Desulfobacca sp.]